MLDVFFIFIFCSENYQFKTVHNKNKLMNLYVNKMFQINKGDYMLIIPKPNSRRCGFVRRKMTPLKTVDHI